MKQSTAQEMKTCASLHAERSRLARCRGYLSPQDKDTAAGVLKRPAQAARVERFLGSEPVQEGFQGILAPRLCGCGLNYACGANGLQRAVGALPELLCQFLALSLSEETQNP